MTGAILSYHRVATPTVDLHGLGVPPQRFRAQMKHLASTCTPMSLVDLTSAALAGRLPPRAVAVTLDDGTIDHLEAARILDEVGIRGTFFVVADRLDAPHEHWWDELETVFYAATPPAVLSLDGVSHPTSTSAERRRAYRAAHRALLRLEVGARRERLSELRAWAEITATVRPSHRALLGSEVKTLAARHEIGAHGVHHLFLDGLSADAQAAELAGGVETLTALLGQRVSSLAYPFGAVDDQAVAGAAAAGVERAVTVADGVVGVGTDRLRLPRLDLGDYGVERFAAELAARLA